MPFNAYIYLVEGCKAVMEWCKGMFAHQADAEAASIAAKKVAHEAGKAVSPHFLARMQQ